MPSTLSWLDYDHAARERSLRVLDLLGESATRDELGVGAVRDAIADQLFPGTSVIQTRLRYFFLVPWLCMKLEDEQTSSAKFPSKLRQAELALSAQLAEGSDTRGVFGKSSGHRLKRLPSSVYWAGLGNWGLRRFPGSQQQYFRQSEEVYRQRSVRRRKDDGEWLDHARGETWHASLRKLMPANFPADQTLAVTRAEAEFLRDQWLTHHRASLLSWLSLEPKRLDIPASVEAPWIHPAAGSFPAPIRDLLDHGRCFSYLMEGAALLYNLALCEHPSRSSPHPATDGYRAKLEHWTLRYGSSGLPDWALPEFWPQIASAHSITPATRAFVERLLASVRACDARIADDASARSTVQQRETAVKTNRSRFTNPNALQEWGGASGLVLLTYRWDTVKTLLGDLHAGLLAK